MQHIVNIAFDFDDNTVKKHIEDNVEKEVIAAIKKDIEQKMFTSRYYNREVNPCEDPLSEWVRSIIVESVLQYKDAIIEQAAKSVTDSITRSKAYREAVAKVSESVK